MSSHIYNGVKVFSAEQCMLGEAPIWHGSRKSLFWLDILERKLYEKSPEGLGHMADSFWVLPEYASAMAVDRDRDDLLWMVTDQSFGCFNLDRGEYQPLVPLRLKTGQRANDGSISPAGDFFFGSMGWSPRELDGEVYSITASGKLINHGLQLGIPNTFCWSREGTHILISDSLQQKTYSFMVTQGIINKGTKTLFSESAKYTGTPDGGAMDVEGCLWNARWGGHKVIKYDRNGNNRQEIALPVPRPASCCFGGINNQQLFITTARVDMNPEELENHPQSGQVFVVDLGVPGAPVFPFSLDS